MARQIAVGIDIGTAQTKVIIAEGFLVDGRFSPKIIGTGLSESRGLSRGFITSVVEATSSVRQALNKAEKVAGVKVKRAFVSFGGVGLSSTIASGSTTISKADLEISEKDIYQALESAENSIPQSVSLNKKIINTIPLEYKIDGKPALGQVVGVRAHRLEVKALFIMCLEHHLRDLMSVVESAGVEVADVVAGPLAESFVLLNKKQKKVGALLANLGAETLSLVTFENGDPHSLEVLPVGLNDLVSDLALGLKIPLEEAENLSAGGLARSSFPKKKLDDIVNARLAEIFGLAGEHLKRINRFALLPAGVTLSGGGATLEAKASAENILKLPAQVGEIHFGHLSENRIKDLFWAVACGLVIVGFNSDHEQESVGRKSLSLASFNTKSLGQTLNKWFSQLLP